VATHTLGTNSNTTLPFAVTYSRSLAPADLATMVANILDYMVSVSAPLSARRWPGSIGSGHIDIPRRGRIKLVEGDLIGVGTTGWPIIVEKAAAAADWHLV
jgi:hypothetical protein